MKQVWRWLRFFPDRYPWFWKNAPYAVMAGIILAVLIIAALPQGVCLGDCGVRDKWCNGGNCGALACQGGTGGHIVVGCHWSSTNNVCADTLKSVTLPCQYGDNCNVSGVNPNQYSGRLYLSNGRSWLKVGACNRSLVGADCDRAAPMLNVNIDKVDCCSGSGGGSGGGCTPDYAPPVIHADQAMFTPPYPLVDGQDPDHVGVAVTVTAEGGKDRNNCGGDQANITDFRVTSIDLAESSRDWILDDLAAWYPGAHILGDYPMLPDAVSLSGKNTNKATLWFHLTPLDPGYYEATVVAQQDKGNKTSTATIKVPVRLLQTSIVR